MGADDVIRLGASDVIAAVRYESPEDGWGVAMIELEEPEFEGRHRFGFAPEPAVSVAPLLWVTLRCWGGGL